jgi:hypothetical protein
MYIKIDGVEITIKRSDYYPRNNEIRFMLNEKERHLSLPTHNFQEALSLAEEVGQRLYGNNSGLLKAHREAVDNSALGTGRMAIGTRMRL